MLDFAFLCATRNRPRQKKSSWRRWFCLNGAGEKSGARGGDRTHNLRLRRPSLYPIELPAQFIHLKKFLQTSRWELISPLRVRSLLPFRKMPDHSIQAYCEDEGSSAYETLCPRHGDKPLSAGMSHLPSVGADKPRRKLQRRGGL